MDSKTHVGVRDARDRLIDLLRLGETYPLRDLAVRDERLTVPLNTAARIPIDQSQSDVQYELQTRDETPLSPAVETPGDGQTIWLETPGIHDDITYKILAKKRDTPRQAYLHETATVKVGLDTTLKAWIRLDDEVQLLDPSVEQATGQHARIIHYGRSVEVEIEHSQEGVDYRLVALQEAQGKKAAKTKDVALSEREVRGTGGNIVLHSTPVLEDTDIRIRASKTFDPSEQRAPQTEVLDAVLALKVCANPELPVTVAPSPVVGHGEDAAITIADTQESVAYEVYVAPIPDRDMLHHTEPDVEAVEVAVEGDLPVQVRRPPIDDQWHTPEGYAPVGVFTPGNGADVQIDLESLTEDTLAIVQGQKEHQDGQGGPEAPGVVSSAIQLEQATAILVRPDPAQPLRLKVFMDGAETNGTMQVFDGQPGVFYSFRLDPQQEPVGPPVYFHKRDDRDDTENKGLGQQRVEVDLVITGDSPAAAEHPAEVAPEPPVVKTGRLPADSTLYVEAVKAQTGLETPLDRTARLGPVPAIRSRDAVVDYDTPATIQVPASRSGQRYQLLLHGEPVGPAQDGNGKTLTFTSDAVREDTGFGMLVTVLPDPGLQVELELQGVAPVLVRPNPAPGLRVTVPMRGDQTDGPIRVDGGQPGVFYHFRLDPDGDDIGLPVYFHERDEGDASVSRGVGRLQLGVDFAVAPAWSAAVPGGVTPGAPTAPPRLETGPLTADTTLHVRAVYARTRTATPLAETVRITGVPDIRPEREVVERAGAATILVVGSREGDLYELTLDGEPVTPAQEGNGGDLAFTTGALEEESTFEMLVTRPSDPGIPVTRVVRLAVGVESAGDAS